MADWTLVEGDEGYDQSFTVTDVDGGAFDLTGYTITLVVWDSSGTVLFSGGCVSAEPETGVCTYTIADGDLDTPGDYWWRIKLTSNSTVTQSTTPATLEIKDVP